MAIGKYKEWLQNEKLILLEGWARDGLSDEQIAHNIGISAKTLYEWKNNYSEFRNALKKGKEVADYEVENALFKKACGYTYEETRVVIKPDGTKEGVQVTKHVPPDTGAAAFWLKNRRPEKWRDKPDNATQDSDVFKRAREILGGIESAIN